MQNLYPTKSKRKLAKRKKEFSKYYLAKVGLKDFKETTIKEIKEHKIPKPKKVYVGYWHVPDFERYKKKKEREELIKMFKKSKSRS